VAPRQLFEFASLEWVSGRQDQTDMATERTAAARVRAPPAGWAFMGSSWGTPVVSDLDVLLHELTFARAPAKADARVRRRDRSVAAGQSR
jgi:hypothetical protein